MIHTDPSEASWYPTVNEAEQKTIESEKAARRLVEVYHFSDTTRYKAPNNKDTLILTLNPDTKEAKEIWGIKAIMRPKGSEDYYFYHSDGSLEVFKCGNFKLTVDLHED